MLNFYPVLSLDSVNEESMTYVTDIFLAQSWRDPRLRLPSNMLEEYRILDVEWLHNIWRPDSFFKNAKKVTFHEMSIPNHYLWLYRDKSLLYMAKYVVHIFNFITLFQQPIPNREYAPHTHNLYLSLYFFSPFYFYRQIDVGAIVRYEIRIISTRYSSLQHANRKS